MNNRLKRIIPFPFALWTVIILNSIVIAFHFLVLFKIIPFDIVWGGKLKSAREMYLFESISIVINCLLIVVVLIKGEIMNLKIRVEIINIFLWIFVIVLALNTIANFASETNLEKFIAIPLTFVLAILCSRLALH